MKSYSFLEEYQQKEVESLNRLVKKTKDSQRKEELKVSLLKASQEMKERRRHLEVEKRLSEIKAKEKEKVYLIKAFFFLWLNRSRSRQGRSRFS